jgi:hypothetical protein
VPTRDRFNDFKRKRKAQPLIAPPLKDVFRFNDDGVLIGTEQPHQGEAEQVFVYAGADKHGYVFRPQRDEQA